MSTEHQHRSTDESDVAAYVNARGWGDEPAAALRATGSRARGGEAVALAAALERDPDVQRRIEAERAQCKAQGRDPATPRKTMLRRIYADQERLLATLQGPQADLLLDIVIDRLGYSEDLHPDRAERHAVMRTALLEMTALEWFIRSAPELYVRVARAIVATDAVPRRLRQEVRRRFGLGFCEPLVKFVRDCVSKDLQPEDLMNVPTRVLAKAHASVAELQGPSLRRSRC